MNPLSGVMIIFLFILGTSSLAWSYSHSRSGNWTSVKRGDNSDLVKTYCKDHYLCVFDSHVWNDKAPETLDDLYVTPLITPPGLIKDSNNMCGLLQERGIDSIYFYGDSFVRQIFAASLITLNGNYKNGSISGEEWARQNNAAGCNYHRQFNEKECGIRQLDRDTHICDGKIQLAYMETDNGMLHHCNTKNEANTKLPKEQRKKTIIVYSGGNHKIKDGEGGRFGVNHAQQHIDHYEDKFCGRLRAKRAKVSTDGEDIDSTAVNRFTASGKQEEACSFWWVSTHRRIIGWFPDEKDPIVEAFNIGMREHFDSGKCGDFNYIDVYNMTDALVSKFHLDATSEQNKQNSMTVSYDYVHYGMEINLWKAQIILDGIIAGQTAQAGAAPPQER